MEGKWIVPFNLFPECNQNFIWNSGSIYIMDNHRAALWCWFQHMKSERKYNLFHIDRHYDTTYRWEEEWRKNTPDMFRISIHDYLAKNYGADFNNDCFFRWDNYLSIFLDCYSKTINECIFATHKDGEKPKFGYQEIEIWDIPDIMDNIDKRPAGVNWILNVDIDYFFCNDESDSQLRMLSSKFIERIFRPVAGRIKDGTISVFTLALSPDYSSGWKNSLIICEKICDILGVNFKL